MFQEYSLSEKGKLKKNYPVSPEASLTTKINYGDDLYWLPELLSQVDPFENEYSFEWKAHLLLKNTEEVQKCRALKERFTFYTSKMVRCVFDFCKVLRQPPEVRYLAIDILDRFLIKHFFVVAETFEQLEHKSAITWRVVVDRMLDQSMLRILTCIQLANKYSWTCNLVTSRTIQEMMTVLGHSYQFSKKSIIKSEARVYQNLDFNIPTRTPLNYLEMFFDEFQKHGFFQLRIPIYEFFVNCIHVLDVAMIHHQQIYQNLIEFVKNDGILEGDSDEYFSVASLKGDYIVLAASIILSSSFLEEPDTETPDVFLKVVCSIGECNKYYVQILGREILNVIQYC